MKLTLEVKVQLAASLDKSAQPVDYHEELSSCPEKELQYYSQYTYQTGSSRSLADPQRKGFRKSIRKIISVLSRDGARKRERLPIPCNPSPLDTSIVDQESKHRRVSELTGSDLESSSKSPVGNYYSAEYKEIPPSEMSPDSPPVELYSPPRGTTNDDDSGFTTPGTPIAEMPGDERQFQTPGSYFEALLPISIPQMCARDALSPYYLTAGESSRGCAEQDSASSRYPNLGNTTTGMTGQEVGAIFDAVHPVCLADPSVWRQSMVPDTDMSNTMTSERVLDSSDLSGGCSNTDFHNQTATNYVLVGPAMYAAPGLLSPQSASHKSSPCSPETPGTGIMLSGYDSSASGSWQSQESTLHQHSGLDWPISHSSTVEILTPNLDVSDASQSLSPLQRILNASNKAFLEGVTQTVGAAAPFYWSGPLYSPFQSYPQQMQDSPTNDPALGFESLSFDTISEEQTLQGFPQTQPSSRRDIIVPSYLPSPMNLSLQESQERTGTWQLGDDNDWIACTPSDLKPEYDEARGDSQIYTMTTGYSTSNLLGNEPGCLDASQADRGSTLKTSYSPVKCNQCGQKYTGQFAKGNMRRHVNQKHGRGLGKNYPCSVCDKSYRRSDARRTYERQMHWQPGNAQNKILARQAMGSVDVKLASSTSS